MDTATGEIVPWAKSLRWNGHSAARQQWSGKSGRLFFETKDAEGRNGFVTMEADGSNQRMLAPPGVSTWKCSPEGRFVFATTADHVIFGPDDSLTPRHDKGIVRVDLETGEQKLVFSIEDAIAMLPDSESIKDFHLHPKQIVIHPTLPRLLFNLVNVPWDLTGREHRVREMFTVGLDGSDPAYLGKISDHPQWDPSGDRVVANVHDINDKRRFGIYPGNGKGLLHYLPKTKGAGHPSLSPCGEWVCSDGRGLPDGRTALIFCHVTSGKEIIAVSAQHHSENANRAAYRNLSGDTSVMSVRPGIEAGNMHRWTTHLHPTWSRDGKTVLFNLDEEDKAGQLYVLDVEAALRSGRETPQT